MKETKKSVKWLVISVVLMILGCIAASGINTNFNSVKVSEISFDTERGTLSAYLYMPKDAGPDNPRPVIVLTHGYLNSKEMQDASAVEMSRRGYIVLVTDQYDHGLSRWKKEIPNGTEFGTFWVYSMFDAVTYAYNQDYTLKDDKGNAYIGCSGHSMGGLSTVMAVYFDEMQSLQSGHRMIYSAIPVSADFTFTNAVAPLEDVLAAYGNRTMGIVSGHYDEFFFGEKEGMYYKNFVTVPVGRKFLGLADGEQGKSAEFYEVASGGLKVEGKEVRESQTGKRIVYLLDEAHAQNHFSTKAEAKVIEFFQTAFQGVTTADMNFADMTPSNQVWWMKELANCVALIGFFLFFVPFVSLITRVGFFKNAVTEVTPVVPLPKSGGGKLVFWVVLLVFSLLPAILFVPLMSKVAADIRIVEIVLMVFAVLMLIVGIINRVKAEKDTSSKFMSYAKGGFWLTGISVILLGVLYGNQLFAQNPYFNSTASNWSAYWSFVLGFLCLIMVVGSYYFVNKPLGVSLEAYGVKVKLKSVLSALTAAIAAFVAGYAILFALHGIFKVDFRIWTLAVKVFRTEHFITMLKYLPMFLLFYVVLSVLLNANTRAVKHSYLTAIGTTAGGCMLWLIVQYGVFYIAGTAMWPTSGMISIGMLAIIPCLIVAAIYTRKLYEVTNNIWTAGFLNAMLFTMITVANTLLLWNLV